MKRAALRVLGALALMGVVLAAFNTWYFFIRLGVGPSFYLERHVTGRAERLEEEPLYTVDRDEYARLNAAYSGPPAIVFVGDSQIRRFRLHERFPGLPILNRGLSSDTTEGLLERWEATVGSLPTRAIFLQIGYNDHEFRSISKALDNTRSLIMLAREQAPRVVVQSLLPVRDREPDANAKIREHNQRLERLAAELGVEWLDLHPHFVDEDGRLSRRLSDDGAHPNGAGYDVWSDLLRARLAGEEAALLRRETTIP